MKKYFYNRLQEKSTWTALAGLAVAVVQHYGGDSDIAIAVVGVLSTLLVGSAATQG